MELSRVVIEADVDGQAVAVCPAQAEEALFGPYFCPSWLLGVVSG